MLLHPNLSSPRTAGYPIRAPAAEANRGPARPARRSLGEGGAARADSAFVSRSCGSNSGAASATSGPPRFATPLLACDVQLSSHCRVMEVQGGSGCLSRTRQSPERESSRSRRRPVLRMRPSGASQYCLPTNFARRSARSDLKSDVPEKICRIPVTASVMAGDATGGRGSVADGRCLDGVDVVQAPGRSGESHQDASREGDGGVDDRFSVHAGLDVTHGDRDVDDV